MDEVTLYLNKTNKAQFCKWLSVYCKRRRVENKTYPASNGWNYNFYYSSDISPDFQSALEISAMFARFTRVASSDETRETYESEDYTIDRAITVSWLEIGERMKVTLNHESGGWTCYPLFDMLAEIGKDWQEMRRDIWTYIQEQAKKYHIELTEQPFPLDSDTAQDGAAKPETQANIRDVLEISQGTMPLGLMLYKAAKHVVDMSPNGFIPNVDSLSPVQKASRGIMAYAMCLATHGKDFDNATELEFFKSGLYDPIIPIFAADFLRQFPTPSSAKEKFPRFISFSDFIATDTLTTIEQILDLSVDEAGILLKAKPLVMDLKNKLLFQNVEQVDSAQDGAAMKKKYNLDRLRKYLPPEKTYTDEELIADLEAIENANLPPLELSGVYQIPIGVKLAELQREIEDARHQEILGAIEGLRIPNESAVLPEITDMTAKRVWELIEKDISLTDTQIAQRLKMARGTVNTGRRILLSMGYPAKRKVSRQKKKMS